MLETPPIDLLNSFQFLYFWTDEPATQFYLSQLRGAFVRELLSPLWTAKSTFKTDYRATFARVFW
jgi:hypothetical protein